MNQQTDTDHANTSKSVTEAFAEYRENTLAHISKLELSEKEWERAIEIMACCQGTVITTGMGKAGHAARKVASSLSSLGIPSSYLHPGEASHGDVGICKAKDVLLAFSTSGKTREVIETIHFARQLNVSYVIAVTSHKDSEIKSVSDVVIDMGDIDESGDLKLAPTTSILMMLYIADFLSLQASAAKGFTRKDFSIRHHGGYLGAKSRGDAI